MNLYESMQLTVDLGRTFRDREERVMSLDDLIGRLNELERRTSEIERAALQLQKVKDELTETAQPNTSAIARWLEGAKNALKTAALGADVNTAAQKLFQLFGLPANEKSSLSRHNLFYNPSQTFSEYPEECREHIAQAFVEAWQWLEREGLLVPKIGAGPGWFAISRRGAKLQTKEDVDAYRHGNLLPKAQLHPLIASKVYPTFLRGDYDTAVFQSFKEVEVAVRDAATLPLTDIGVALMRKAYDKTTGPLTDKNLPDPEREATAHLFAGAIGLYKNPHSHRNVPLHFAANIDNGHNASRSDHAPFCSNLREHAVNG